MAPNRADAAATRIEVVADLRGELGNQFAGKLVVLTALRYGPAGVAGWAVKSVARRPLKMLLALEPLLSRLANRVTRGMK